MDKRLGRTPVFLLTVLAVTSRAYSAKLGIHEWHPCCMLSIHMHNAFACLAARLTERTTVVCQIQQIRGTEEMMLELMEKALPTLIVSLFCVFFLSCAAALNPIERPPTLVNGVQCLHSPKKDEACSALQRLYGRPRDLRGADGGLMRLVPAGSIRIGGYSKTSYRQKTFDRYVEEFYIRRLRSDQSTVSKVSCG